MLEIIICTTSVAQRKGEISEAFSVAATVLVWIWNGLKISLNKGIFLFIFSVYLFPSENKVWNLLTWWLSSRLWYCLRPMCGSPSSPACVHWGGARATLCYSAMCCSILCCAVPSCAAMPAPLLGAKWFLSLQKQSPSNLSPLRSIWTHFTLTRRKTGNMRLGLGQELSPQVKGLQCVSVCAVWHLSKCVLDLFTLMDTFYEKRCVCTVYMLQF